MSLKTIALQKKKHEQGIPSNNQNYTHSLLSQLNKTTTDEPYYHSNIRKGKEDRTVVVEPSTR